MAQALGLHNLVPPGLLAGKWLMVICYLDDSGKDPQNVVTTLAGFVAREASWRAFEAEVEPFFKKRKVEILHAKELESTKGEFEGWKIIQKQAFVSEVSRTLAKHSMLGVSMSCVKEQYDTRTKERGKKRTNRPYTFCFNVILDWLLRDIRTGKAVWSEGLSLILEAGHENNPEAERAFYSIRKKHGLENVLKSICFVPKDNSRAIQAADLFAFYTRRDSNRLEKASRKGAKPYEMETMLKIITEKGPFRGYVATDFGPNINASTFFAGDLK